MQEKLGVIFASLKKNLDEAHKLNYKDKFLEKNVFQWETIHDISESELQKQKN